MCMSGTLTGAARPFAYALTVWGGALYLLAGVLYVVQAVGLLRDPSFAIFFGLAFAITIALAFYYTWTGVYLETAAGLVVWGTGSGSPRDPDWFQNLRQAGTAEVQVRDRRFTARARELHGEYATLNFPQLGERAA